MGRQLAGPFAILAGPMTASAIARPGSARRRSSKLTTALLFVLPALLVYAVFVVIPVIQAIYYSGFKWNGLKPLTDFVGLANYERALSDPVFHSAIAHNVFFVTLSLVIQIPFALGLALMLNGRFRGRAVFRLIFFAPYVLSEVITAAIWQLLLMPDSFVDKAFAGIGLGGLTQLWLADRSVVLFTLFIVISWKYFGFHMILLLAGLQGIPHELEEAAAIDGATRRQAIRYVVLPLLGPTLRVSVFLSLIGALQLFDLIWVMTGGGPANASNTMATYLFDWGFRRFQLGYGSAVAVILFGMSFLIALAYQRFVLRRDTEGAVTTAGG
jgi:raffinose/stachyose/melibiose transport system permease protein